jgi:hypothetical protein
MTARQYTFHNGMTCIAYWSPTGTWWCCCTYKLLDDRWLPGGLCQLDSRRVLRHLDVAVKTQYEIASAEHKCFPRFHHFPRMFKIILAWFFPIRFVVILDCWVISNVHFPLDISNDFRFCCRSFSVYIWRCTAYLVSHFYWENICFAALRNAINIGLYINLVYTFTSRVNWALVQ